MTARIIDGKAIAKRVRAELLPRVQALAESGITPALAVIMVGNDAASKVYVGNKVRACGEMGMRCDVHQFSPDTPQERVEECIRALNEDPEIHGILVQLPLPAHYDARKLIALIELSKDVDGFHLYNVGALVVGEQIFPPCTPYGVAKLLDVAGIPVAGQNVVVVGASNIVGKPMAMMLLAREATVAICHVRTRDLTEFSTLADILIVGVGKPGLITAPMVKPGSVVIDVGMNRLASGRFTGDVDFEAVRERASFITPVPGGVGPMTVTMLMSNTVTAAERCTAPACVD
ncbi:MAG TPA: bifunctional methylenetetrahydrofolate dehydrogenase/methenyltetrahydrofolate cyclohydrolase FolD [Gammaproteobacteria bacterium]|nr:bifunctional methylenetetrahydrofolate dehydrogenase/methenyltetrahydrofolate cyclohydrolase FolD [Gammaproteobacteria bacterium]